MSVGDRHIVVATAASADSAQEWLECENVARVVALRHPSPSGKRWGKLAFGLGVDAAVVAVKTRLSTARRSPVLTTNPWIAAALRVLGHRNLVSIGIFAAPGSRTWALFRRLLPSCGMVVLSEVENANWSQAGGNSRFVRYGNSFPYPDVPSPERRAGRTAIFIGGASDRDHSLIDEFARHVLESGREIDLVIATGGSPSTESSDSAVVTRLSSVTQREFGRLLASADVSFLPLVENGRSAGHMFIVGSLQVGTPVVFTKVKGMSEYEDSRYCRAVPRTEDALEFVLEAAAAAPDRDETRAFWERTYSRAAFRRSVLTAAMDMFQGARRDA